MAWRSLTATQFKADLYALGFTVSGSGDSPKGWTYGFADLTVPFQDLQQFLNDLAPGIYYYDSQGYHYVQDPGAVDSSGNAAKVTTDMVSAPGTTVVPIGTAVNAYDSWNEVTLPGTWGTTAGSAITPAPSTTGGTTTNADQMWHIWDEATGTYTLSPNPPAAASPAIVEDGSTTTTSLTNFGIAYGDTVEAAVADNPNVSAADLANQLKWQEDAIYSGIVDGEALAEVFGITWGSDEWYNLASGAQGSGEMRAKLQEAMNRLAFREDYRNYFGTDPGPADYEYLDSNFVSPSEFANRMKAKESAKSMFGRVNELLGRTLDHQVSLEELENMVMGGKDSGSLEALIDEATRLDAYTDSLYQRLGHAPTADDYAREVAKYSSVNAFKWEITVQEKMAEMGDDIGDTFQKAYGYRLDDAQLKILLGQSEGWGELQKKYNKALEEEEKQETNRRYAMQSEKITPAYSQAFQGGFRTGLPELPDLGGM